MLTLKKHVIKINESKNALFYLIMGAPFDSQLQDRWSALRSEKIDLPYNHSLKIVRKESVVNEIQSHKNSVDKNNRVLLVPWFLEGPSWCVPFWQERYVRKPMFKLPCQKILPLIWKTYPMWNFMGSYF
jgi:hypothetical protein